MAPKRDILGVPGAALGEPSGAVRAADPQFANNGYEGIKAFVTVEATEQTQRLRGVSQISKATKERWAKFRAAKAKGKH